MAKTTDEKDVGDHGKFLSSLDLINFCLSNIPHAACYVIKWPKHLRNVLAVILRIPRFSISCKIKILQPPILPCVHHKYQMSLFDSKYMCVFRSHFI